MDRKTAHDTYLRHRPSGWLAAIRINRCVDGCGRWPCNIWITARDERARDDTATMDHIHTLAGELRAQTAAGVEAMTDTIGRRPSDELGRHFGGATNQGRWT